MTRNDLPLVPRSKEGLVEGFCAIKHKTHKCEVGHVPIVERLVEGVCVLKHPLHIRHFGHVPLVERLVEGFCSSKHPSHIRHVGHVPLVERLVRRIIQSKHSTNSWWDYRPQRPYNHYPYYIQYYDLGMEYVNGAQLTKL